MFKKIVVNVLFIGVLFALQDDIKHQKAEKSIKQAKKPLYIPLVERYILDELKSIRIDNQQLREPLKICFIF